MENPLSIMGENPNIYHALIFPFRRLEDADPSAHDIKKLVEQNKRHMERLEREIPSKIKITAFEVVVDHVREGILKRKKNLINAILDSYASKLRKIIQKVF